jgi:hypothetical protein
MLKGLRVVVSLFGGLRRYLNDNNLTGTVPSELEAMTRLYAL